MHDRGFDRVEQVFEYFLIDPGMEPVVQTSRLRLAISSVQLFIQRCLLNLEPDVHPSAIDAEQWQWMKRYRVWEANRKIFLFPENWLEPEFRDDKTHLYRTMEGELFQEDLSNDLAESAFLGYLKQLDELARLDVVAMHVDEKADARNNVLHVIGRTFNLPQKYFHRRYAHGMWTPWEPIGADIEGDHVLATIWRDRLHVFWLTLLDKPAMESGGVTLDLGMQVSKTFPRRVEIQLNWCEQIDGEWATRTSSGFGRAISTTVAPEFDGSDGFMHATKRYNADGTEGPLDIHLSGSFRVRGQGAFATAVMTMAYRLESKNSPPRRDNGTSRAHPPFTTLSVSSSPTRFSAAGPLEMILGDRSSGPPPTDTVLRRGRVPTDSSFALLPTNGSLDTDVPRTAALRTPFFYTNSHHSFFVEPRVSQVLVKDHEGFGIEPEVLHIDEKELPIEVELPELGKPVPVPIDPRAKYTVTARADWLTGEGAVVRYGEREIGREGGLR